MNRKQFIKKIFQAGMCGCGAAMGFGQSADQDWIKDLEKRMIKGAETPSWAKVEKAEHWFKALMENMDALLDKETKIGLMQACGRACYIRAFGVAPEEKPSAEESERFLQSLKSRGYEVIQENGSTAVIYNWGRDHQNPWGLIMRDGYCMCPLVETGPPGLSPKSFQSSIWLNHVNGCQFPARPVVKAHLTASVVNPSLIFGFSLTYFKSS